MVVLQQTQKPRGRDYLSIIAFGVVASGKVFFRNRYARGGKRKEIIPVSLGQVRVRAAEECHRGHKTKVPPESLANKTSVSLPVSVCEFVFLRLWNADCCVRRAP